MFKNHKVQLGMGIAILVLTFLVTIQFKSVTINNEQNKQQNLRVDELLSELKKEREEAKEKKNRDI